MTMERTWTGKVFIATSLDGYIAREDGDIDWLVNPPMRDGHRPADPDVPPEFRYDGHIAAVDEIVMGRGTYEKALTFGTWPYPDHTAIVVSTTRSPGQDDRVTIVRSIDEALTELYRRRATGVYVDGGTIVQEFLRRDLVDEVTLTHTPVLLGAGLRLFGWLPEDVHLTHLGTASIEAGMVTSRYAVDRR
jgi:dihydrofolate reductase